MGGVSAGRFSPAFGAAIGEQNHTLTAAEMAPHTHGFAGTTGADAPDHTHNVPNTIVGGGGVNIANGGGLFSPGNTTSGGRNQNHFHTFGGATDTGSGVAGAAHNVTQPTIVCNYIMRII